MRGSLRFGGAALPGVILAREVVAPLTSCLCRQGAWKAAALFDRAQPKDFVDVYFLVQDYESLDDLIETARRKHLGMDDYFLAQAFARSRHVANLPRMIRPLALDELRRFFLDAAARLMAQVTG